MTTNHLLAQIQQDVNAVSGTETQVSAFDNAKKKAKKYWKTKGNKNLDPSKHFLGTKDSVPLIIKTFDVERMRITETGFVGIGTAVPNFPFEVAVTSRFQDLFANSIVTQKLSIGDLHFCKGVGGAVDTIHTTSGRSLRLAAANNFTAVADTMQLAATNNLTAVAETVRIVRPVPTGNVRLEVQGDMTVRDIYLNSPSVQPYKLLTVDATSKVVSRDVFLGDPPPEPDPTCTNLRTLPWFVSADTTGSLLDSSNIIKRPLKGRVGIGTCVPQAKFDVVNIENQGLTFSARDASGQFDFVVNKNGFVGIGTASPAQTLHIYGADVGLRIGPSNSYVDLRYDGANAILNFHSPDSNKYLFINPSSGKPVAVGTGIKPANFLVSGKIGIGLVKSPSEALHVVAQQGKMRVGESSDYIQLGYDGVNGVLDFYSSNSSKVLLINSNSGRDVAISTGANPANLFVSGKVGIGSVTSPSEMLHIQAQQGKMRVGESSDYIQLGYDGVNGILDFQSSDPNKYLLINYFSGRDVAFGTGTKFVNVTVGGDLSVTRTLYVADHVGIGTNPLASYSLAVCGNIKSQEVKVVPPGWCDYVFEADYELTPWDSLMQFVKIHKHLPGVPSAKQVENEGVFVGEMSKILLQKIEELVLYNDRLHKRVKELEEKVESLKRVNGSGN